MVRKTTNKENKLNIVTMPKIANVTFERINAGWYGNHYRVTDEGLVRLWQRSSDTRDFAENLWVAWDNFKQGLVIPEGKGVDVTGLASVKQRAKKMIAAGVPLKPLPYVSEAQLRANRRIERLTAVAEQALAPHDACAACGAAA